MVKFGISRYYINFSIEIQNFSIFWYLRKTIEFVKNNTPDILQTGDVMLYTSIM